MREIIMPDIGTMPEVDGGVPFSTRPDEPGVAELRAKVRRVLGEFTNAERLTRHDEDETYDFELHEALGAAGLIGLEADLDGHGPSHVSQAVVLEELGAGATSIGVSFVVQYMGVELLHRYGTDVQRQDWLRPLLEGSARMSFGLSEPAGGTDVASQMATRAERRDDGSWKINGAKKWIGGASTATFIILLARTSAVEKSGVDGITMFIVPRDTPGITTTPIDTMGIRGLEQADVFLDDVVVPHEMVLGEVGTGFRNVLATLNGERLNGAAVALGIARGALTYAVGYAQGRSAFGKPIGSFQGLQHPLVDVLTRTESARHLLYNGTAMSDEESGEAVENLSGLAKLSASEAATTATDIGMRVMGGWGFHRQLPMQRYFRDARLYTFAPLTDEMIRNQLAQRHLGLPRST